MENIEKYFVSGNEYWNTYAFSIYEKARKQRIFTDLETPLHYLKEYVNIFWNNHEHPLLVAQQLLSVLKEDALTDEQQYFIFESLYDYFRVTEFTTEEGEIVNLDLVAKVLWLEMAELKPAQKGNEYSFDFEQVLIELEDISDPKDKISHLVKVKSAYEQSDLWDFSIGPNFGEKCDSEIQKWKEILALEQNETQVNASLHLSPRRGTKTDLIRILSALYALDFFRNEEGLKLEKIEVMKRVGAFLGEDWSKYDKDLSQAFLQSEKANTQVFEQLMQEIQKQYKESEARRI